MNSDKIDRKKKVDKYTTDKGFASSSQITSKKDEIKRTPTTIITRTTILRTTHLMNTNQILKNPKSKSIEQWWQQNIRH